MYIRTLDLFTEPVDLKLDMYAELLFALKRPDEVRRNLDFMGLKKLNDNTIHPK